MVGNCVAPSRFRRQCAGPCRTAAACGRVRDIEIVDQGELDHLGRKSRKASASMNSPSNSCLSEQHRPEFLAHLFEKLGADPRAFPADDLDHAFCSNRRVKTRHCCSSPVSSLSQRAMRLNEEVSMAQAGALKHSDELLVCGHKPAIARKSMVLPVPGSPTISTRSPGAISICRSLSAVQPFGVRSFWNS